MQSSLQVLGEELKCARGPPTTRHRRGSSAVDRLATPIVCQPSTYLADLFRKQLGGCLAEDEAGRPTLTVRLPDRSSLDALAGTLGRLLAEHRLGNVQESV